MFSEMLQGIYHINPFRKIGRIDITAPKYAQTPEWKWRIFKEKVKANTIYIFAVLLLVAGLCSLYLIEDNSDSLPKIFEVLKALAPELVGISITVLLIERLSNLFHKKTLKEQLIRELGSKDSSISLKAADDLRFNGWVTDGSLRNVSLPEAELSRVDLSEADLIRSNFSRANLREAELWNAKLNDALLAYAKLNKAYLNGANLANANLGHARIKKAVLEKAVLDDVWLKRAKLQDANLSLAKLRRAILIAANLTDSQLYKTNLQYSDLRGANLTRASLHHANLRNANLRDATLDDVNMTNAVISREQLAEVKSLRNAILPNGIRYETWIKNNSF